MTSLLLSDYSDIDNHNPSTSSSKSSRSISIPIGNGKKFHFNYEREMHSLNKKMQRNWFNLWTLINNLPHLFSVLLKIFGIVICVILLNVLVTTVFTKFLAQITVGIGGNIMWWHHSYITPDKDIIQCQQNNTHQLYTSSNCNNTVYDEDNIKIPKIIHQTYKSFHEIPERWHSSVALWKKYHSNEDGWTYMFWSDEDLHKFMYENYKWFMPIYDSYPNNIQRVDAARYFLIYHYGGIYSDLDIAPKKNIKSLLASNIDVMLVETPNLGTTNSLFAAKKNSDFLFYVIDHLAEYYDTGFYRWFLPNHLSILFSTGPTAFWALYGRYWKNGGREDIGILSNKYFGRLPVCFPNPGGYSPDITNINETLKVDAQYRIENDFDSSSSSIMLGCDIASFSSTSYFYHVEGNSWHSDSSWYINFFLNCQPVTTVFAVGMITWIIYNLYKQDSTIMWLKDNAIFISGCLLLTLTMYFWHSVLFYLQKFNCK